jgi:hypothetical protein
MSPKSRAAKRRSRAFSLDLVTVRSEIVMLKWCSPYYQTRSSRIRPSSTLPCVWSSASVCKASKSTITPKALSLFTVCQ